MGAKNGPVAMEWVKFNSRAPFERCFILPTFALPQDKHRCVFDYRKAGKEKIAKNNPKVEGKKLDKI